jgi:hypothetical protein
MGEIHIDQAWLCHQFRNTLDTLPQDIICQLESQVEGQVARRNLQQAVAESHARRPGSEAMLARLTDPGLLTYSVYHRMSIPFSLEEVL